MKLGVIGSGIIVTEFLPKLVHMEGMEVVAVMDLPQSKEHLEELCKDNGIKNAVYSFEELVALDIDTVYIAVPNFLHYMYCKQALEAGKNVIVEKPMCSNDSETKELKKIAEEKNLFLFEAITTIHFDAFRKIQDWLTRIGTVKLVNCNYSQYSRRYDAFRDGTVLPAFDPNKSGGALMDLNLYNLHFVMGLFGEPNTVKYYANIERDIDTSGELIMEYDGFIANCTAAKDCGAKPVYFIQGTDGYITTELPPNLIGKITLHLNDGSEEEYEDGTAYERLIPEFKDFIHIINTNNHEECNKYLDMSITVSEVQTKARLDAGIVFPADMEKH